MTATILSFPERPAQRDRTAAAAPAGAIISLDTHRGVTRPVRTPTGVYFVTSPTSPPEDSSAA